MRTTRRELCGWGRTSPSVADLVDASADELTADLVSGLGAARGAIARGLGRAYGDPAQNGGGVVVRLAPGPIHLDAASGTVRVGAGVSLDELMRHIVPRGWFVPVTPGTRFVTIGGAIASDIHGKNHHADGSFGAHVERLTLFTADGAHRVVSPNDEPELWWATLGGMGLTGVIVEATVRLLPIETSRCVVDTERVPNLDALLERMESGDHRYRYSVAWVDLVARGAALGRAVLTRGDHATLAELADLDPKAAQDPLAFGPPSLVAVPPGLPNVLSRPAVRAFNELWYRKAPRFHRGVESITGFFHPLDMVGDWNRLYGRPGFLQYQFVVPFDAVDTFRSIIAMVAASGHASFLAVLKRFGPESGGLMSFPTPGWTLTLDLPAAAPGLDELLTELDRRVLSVGGRHYLAKDATTTPEVIRAGYPRLDEFLDVRRRIDPDGVWASDQARRLDLR
ncbi:MAG TPA: FAD-binding oxidoreductase [Ilumatobacteraceae bacterium]|nr:FAD-binding oxidoreductase [Ilumatobacteraceae bacterium]